MIKRIKLAGINTESGTQTRVNLNEETIANYAEDMENGADFPPVTVFHDGNEFYLADGFHRVMSAIRNGKKDIEADVRKGSCLDALKHALGANMDHGLRRTNADKRKCVSLALASFGKMSDRAIADLCGVGNKFVGDMRTATCVQDTPSTRQGKDGKTYPAKVDRGEEESAAGEVAVTSDKPRKRDVPHGSFSNWQTFKEKHTQIIDLLCELKELRPDVNRIFDARELLEQINLEVDSILKKLN